MVEVIARPAAVLWGEADLRLLDDAVDFAARMTRATVSEFLAAPSSASNDVGRWIDVAIEFFVPPCSEACFADELDRAMVRRSMEYSAVRRSGMAGPVHVLALSPSAFHQWRLAWKVTHQAQHARRWSTDREMLEQVLHYAATGWREVGPLTPHTPVY